MYNSGGLGTDWVEMLATVVDKGLVSSARDQDFLLRTLNGSFIIAPRGGGFSIPEPLPELELERLIRCRAFESAFFRMSDGSLNWLVSQNHAGTAIATIGIPGGVSECTKEGATATIALCTATAAALLISASSARGETEPEGTFPIR